MLDDLGLAAAAEWLVADFVSRYGIDTEADISIGGEEPSKPVATTLFRVVQEALTNTPSMRRPASPCGCTARIHSAN